MKDYRLSEIKEICGELHAKYRECACDECYIGTMCWKVCDESIPKDWDDIEPRDMIELPCKMEYEGKYGKCWKVYYRNVLDGTIDNKGFYDETQADEFLQELKNGKV